MMELYKWSLVLNIVWKFKTNAFEREQTICHGEYVTVSCEPGYIFITDIFYGRESSSICWSRNRNSGICTSTAADTDVYQWCNKQPFCYLSVNRNSFNGRECTHVDPYVRIRYTCNTEKSTQAETTTQSSETSTDKSKVDIPWTSYKSLVGVSWTSDKSRVDIPWTSNKSIVDVPWTSVIILISIGSLLCLATLCSCFVYFHHRRKRHSQQLIHYENHEEFWKSHEFDTIADTVHHVVTDPTLLTEETQKIACFILDKDMATLVCKSHSESDIGHTEPKQDRIKFFDDSEDKYIQMM